MREHFIHMGSGLTFEERPEALTAKMDSGGKKKQKNIATLFSEKYFLICRCMYKVVRACVCVGGCY